MPGFIHAKNFVSDDSTAIVGTINMDYRSLYLHFECATLMYKTPSVSRIKMEFFEYSCKITKNNHGGLLKKRPLIKRIIGGIFRMIAPLM